MASPASARKAFAITPADGTILARKPKTLFVGGAGDIAVILAHDDPTDTGADVVIFKNVPAGTKLDISVKRVMATGTTALHILGLV